MKSRHPRITRWLTVLIGVALSASAVFAAPNTADAQVQYLPDEIIDILIEMEVEVIAFGNPSDSTPRWALLEPWTDGDVVRWYIGETEDPRVILTRLMTESTPTLLLETGGNDIKEQLPIYHRFTQNLGPLAVDSPSGAVIEIGGGWYENDRFPGQIFDLTPQEVLNITQEPWTGIYNEDNSLPQAVSQFPDTEGKSLGIFLRRTYTRLKQAGRFDGLFNDNPDDDGQGQNLPLWHPDEFGFIEPGFPAGTDPSQMLNFFAAYNGSLALFPEAVNGYSLSLGNFVEMNATGGFGPLWWNPDTQRYVGFGDGLDLEGGPSISITTPGATSSSYDGWLPSEVDIDTGELDVDDFWDDILDTLNWNSFDDFTPDYPTIHFALTDNEIASIGDYVPQGEWVFPSLTSTIDDLDTTFENDSTLTDELALWDPDVWCDQVGFCVDDIVAEQIESATEAAEEVRQNLLSDAGLPADDAIAYVNEFEAELDRLLYESPIGSWDAAHAPDSFQEEIYADAYETLETAREAFEEYASVVSSIPSVDAFTCDPFTEQYVLAELSTVNIQGWEDWISALDADPSLIDALCIAVAAERGLLAYANDVTEPVLLGTHSLMVASIQALDGAHQISQPVGTFLALTGIEDAWVEPAAIGQLTAFAIALNYTQNRAFNSPSIFNSNRLETYTADIESPRKLLTLARQLFATQTDALDTMDHWDPDADDLGLIDVLLAGVLEAPVSLCATPYLAEELLDEAEILSGLFDEPQLIRAMSRVAAVELVVSDDEGEVFEQTGRAMEASSHRDPRLVQQAAIDHDIDLCGSGASSDVYVIHPESPAAVSLSLFGTVQTGALASGISEFIINAQLQDQWPTVELDSSPVVGDIVTDITRSYDFDHLSYWTSGADHESVPNGYSHEDVRESLQAGSALNGAVLAAVAREIDFISQDSAAAAALRNAPLITDASGSSTESAAMLAATRAWFAHSGFAQPAKLDWDSDIALWRALRWLMSPQIGSGPTATLRLCASSGTPVAVDIAEVAHLLGADPAQADWTLNAGTAHVGSSWDPATGMYTPDPAQSFDQMTYTATIAGEQVLGVLNLTIECGGVQNAPPSEKFG